MLFSLKTYFCFPCISQFRECPFMPSYMSLWTKVWSDTFPSKATNGLQILKNFIKNIGNQMNSTKVSCYIQVVNILT